MKNNFIFLTVFLIVFISRLPFLTAGYGTEQDGWRVAAAARHIGVTGEYKASRLPGFPLVEFACSLVWKQGAWAMNMLTALASSIAVGILALIARYYKCKDYILLALTFAFTPVVFINSTVTMDYLWAMMFITFSWYSGLKEKPIVAGLCLGLAAGCRITTVMMALPFALFFYNKEEERKSISRIIKFWMATGIGIIVIFLPVFLHYSTRFITDYRRDSFPPLIISAKFFTVDVWGIIGTIVIAAILLFSLMRKRKNDTPSIPINITHVNIHMWMAAFLLLILEFVVHPMKSGYVIPLIPFFLLLSARYLLRYQFLIMCSGILFSSFFVSVDSADRQWSPKPSPMSIVLHERDRTMVIDVLQGPIWNDHSRRIQRMNFIHAIIAAGDTIKEKSVIVAGSWLPYIIQATPFALPESEATDYVLCRNNIQYIDMMNNDLLLRFKKEGMPLYYLPSVETFNGNVFGIDLKKEGAKELVPWKL